MDFSSLSPTHALGLVPLCSEQLAQLHSSPGMNHAFQLSQEEEDEDIETTSGT